MNKLFIINHSGGKDSQAMYLYLTRELLIPRDQIVVIHAVLPGVDWGGSEDHINATVDEPVIYTQANKTFRDMVLKRNQDRPEDPSFPSPQYRQCTSDLKRDPINKEIRRICKETGIYDVVNCIGIRAQESPARAKKDPYKLNKRMSKAGRTVYDWLPIFDWTEKEVFDYIEDQGQKPFWTYGEGMKRKSCMFCIMACESDIRTAARLAPEKFREMVELEERTNSTMFNGKSLTEIQTKTV